jgi:uncharacterized protein (DUF2236 family)
LSGSPGRIEMSAGPQSGRRGSGCSPMTGRSGRCKVIRRCSSAESLPSCFSLCTPSRWRRWRLILAIRVIPWGRLQRTSYFLAVTAFGPAAEARAAIDRVRSIHRRVAGVAPDGRPYAASDPELLTWVHVAEADSFLRAYAAFGSRPLTQAERDGYVADMAVIGARLGVPDPPVTQAGLTAAIERFRPELRGTPQSREAARFLLLRPPLPAVARLPYAVLAGAAVSVLPGWAHRHLMLPRLPVTEAALVRPAGRAMVKGIRWATASPRPATPAEP